MEYSHYATKVAYQRHTQHGGGRTKKSPLVQTYQCWYRIIQHRFHEKTIKANATHIQDGEDHLTIEAKIQKRREASAASSSNAHSSLCGARNARESVLNGCLEMILQKYKEMSPLKPMLLILLSLRLHHLLMQMTGLHFIVD